MWNDDHVTYSQTYPEQVEIAKRFVGLLTDYTFDANEVSMSSWRINLKHKTNSNAGLTIDTHRIQSKFHIYPNWPSRQGKNGLEVFQPEMKKGQHSIAVNIPKDASNQVTLELLQKRVLDKYYPELNRQLLLMAEAEEIERIYQKREEEFGRFMNHTPNQYERDTWRLTGPVNEVRFLHDPEETRVLLTLRSIPMNLAMKLVTLLNES